MDEDHTAEVTLREREEELRVGARALTRTLTNLESRALLLRHDLDKPGAVDALEELGEDIYRARWGLYELTASALGGHYNAADVALWCERAVEMGATHPRLDQALLMDLVHVRKVPNEPLRARYIEVTGDDNDATTAVSPARVVHKVHQILSKIEEKRGEKYGAASLFSGDRNIPQSRVIERWLGMRTSSGNGDSPPTLRLFVSYEQAEALALALDLSPHAAGI